MRTIETTKNNYRPITEYLSDRLPSQMRGSSGEIVAVYDDRYFIGDSGKLCGYYRYTVRAGVQASAPILYVLARFSSKELLPISTRVVLDLFNARFDRRIPIVAVHDVRAVA